MDGLIPPWGDNFLTMSIFNYKAKTRKGQTVKGMVEAVTEEVAADILKDKNLIIIRINRKKRIFLLDKLSEKFFHRIKTKDLVVFFRQLSVLISANISLFQSLRILAKQTRNEHFQNVILDIADDIEGGNRLSDSLDKYPQSFNNFITNMIRSGETSGKLEEVLIYLANQLEQDYDMMSKIRGAMIYPAFVFGMLIVVGVVVMVFVIPKLTSVFMESEAKLPMTTVFLINFSNFIINFWWLLLFIFIVLLSFFQVYVRTAFGRRQWDALKLKVPIVGTLFQRIYLVRFTRSFSTLLTGGVVITKALEVTKEVIGNVVYKELIAKTTKEVEDGNSLISVFSRSSYIPTMVTQMIAVGEEAGKLDVVLTRITDFYTKEVETSVKNLLTLLEPLVIVLMGLAVAGLVTAVIMPIYNLASQF